MLLTNSNNPRKGESEASQLVNNSRKKLRDSIFKFDRSDDDKNTWWFNERPRGTITSFNGSFLINYEVGLLYDLARIY